VIESSLARRVHRGLALWRSQGTEIRPMRAGGLSVPSCTEPGRIYKVSLADEGRCSCADWQYRRQPCKHVFAALIWAAKQRRALVLAEKGRAAMLGRPPPSTYITVSPRYAPAPLSGTRHI
jgi:hypothetical protein